MPPASHDIAGYRFGDAAPVHTDAYLLPVVREALATVAFPTAARRVFDLGCGNGATAAALTHDGYTVTGVDPSTDGIRQAQAAHPHLDLHLGSAYDDLASAYGTFPALISLEVVEHVYDPRAYAATAFDLVAPGGLAVFSTPYHGYLKNVVIALTGRYDRHHNPLWDHGHIKFWSIATLGALLRQAGFRELAFRRVGRVPALAKSMVALARKPPA